MQLLNSVGILRFQAREDVNNLFARKAIGDETEITRWLSSNYSGGTIKPPFNVPHLHSGMCSSVESI